MVISHFEIYGLILIQLILLQLNSFKHIFEIIEIPQFRDSYLIASQGMALMKIPFNATRSNPGVPMYMQASMTATSLDIDCVQGKV